MAAQHRGKVAIVTGANRGLGFETSRQLASQGVHVILTCRDERKGMQALTRLQDQGLNVSYRPLDVTSESSITSLRQYIESEFKGLDILVNNAGIFIDREEHAGDSDVTAFDVPLDKVRATMETNVYGPFRLCQLMIPLMKKRGSGRIVNVSSGMGQLTEMNAGYPAYRISKTALNAVTRIFSEELKGTDILVNSVCPGWVRTDMGGPHAELTPEEGAETIVWLSLMHRGGPSGGFFRNKEPIEW